MDAGDAEPGSRPDANPLPPSLRSALESRPLERKGWQTSIAPAYIATFLWVVYFDQLPRRTLAIGGLGWSVAGAAAAGLLCYGLLYYVPAMWGQRTRRPLSVLASSTFGTTGTIGLTFIGLAVAQVVWLGVATYYAVDWSLQGFSSFGLLNSRHLASMTVKLPTGGSLELRSPLFLITSLFWIYAATLVGRYLVRIIVALMNVYPIFPALMLALAMLLTIRGVSGFEPLRVDPATQRPVTAGGLRALAMMIQMVFGFFALAGASSADWGTVARTPRDVRVGGLVGVAFASWTVATLALLTVAGALGRFPAPPGLRSVPGVGNFSVRVALVLGVPETLAGIMFLVFGLASLAQTCYAAYVMSHRLADLRPGVSKVWFALIGATAAWGLVATGLAIRLETIFTLMGAFFAPMVGAMAADCIRLRGGWPGPRRGVNFAGLAAWLLGAAVGVLPLVAAAGGSIDPVRIQPAAVYAFVTALVAYWALATLGVEPTTIVLPEPGPPPEAAVAPEPVGSRDGDA